MAVVETWASHFGLARPPFAKSIAAANLFERTAHKEAVARIRYLIAEMAMGAVTGDVGAGKSVALRAAVATLDKTRHTVVYVANPMFGTRGLYVSIVSALGAVPRFHKAEVMAQAATLLAAEEAERHRKVLVAIDLCRGRDYADLLAPHPSQPLRWRAPGGSGPGGCRHNHRLSRKARIGSAGR